LNVAKYWQFLLTIPIGLVLYTVSQGRRSCNSLEKVSNIYRRAVQGLEKIVTARMN